MEKMNPEWRTSNVCGIAGSIRAEWNVSLCPILSDALRDAGCEDEDYHAILQKPRKNNKVLRLLIEGLSNYTHPSCPDELRDGIFQTIWSGSWADGVGKNSWVTQRSMFNESAVRRVSMQYVPGEPVHPSGRSERRKDKLTWYYITSYSLALPAFRLMRSDGKLATASIIETRDPVRLAEKRQLRADWGKLHLTDHGLTVTDYDSIPSPLNPNNPR